MPTREPRLGSLAIQTPVDPPQIVHVSAATCHDLSLFKDILKEYRRLDDTITMRLNRANAAMRDQERNRDSVGTSNVQEQACASVWRELVGNWNRRSKLVEYCVFVADQSLADQRNAMEEQSTDPAAQRKTQAAILADGVKHNQIRNELTVESIVQKRAIEAFRSRCPYFSSPKINTESRRV